MATLVTGTGLCFSFIVTLYKTFAIAEGKFLPPPNFIQDIEDAAEYTLIAELLYWTTIFSVKWSFLFYFRALTHHLKRMEVWWWFVLVILVPVSSITISGPFIVCPHAGRSIICTPSPLFTQYG